MSNIYFKNNLKIILSGKKKVDGRKSKVHMTPYTPCYIPRHHAHRAKKGHTVIDSPSVLKGEEEEEERKPHMANPCGSFLSQLVRSHGPNRVAHPPFDFTLTSQV